MGIRGVSLRVLATVLVWGSATELRAQEATEPTQALPEAQTQTQTGGAVLPTIEVTTSEQKPATKKKKKAPAPEESYEPVQSQASTQPNRDPGTPPPTGTIGQPPAAYAGGQVASGTQVGMLGNRDVFDTPFSVTGYTSKLIEDQQAHTINEILDNNPSVRTNSPRYSGIDGFFIRGFPVFSTEIAFDGLYGIVDKRRTGLESIERVEVLKGPSQLLSGIQIFGNVGGGINFVPKRAEDEPLTRITTSYASDAQFGTHLDLGRRYGLNKEWGVRFNGAYRNGDTPIDFQGEELGLAALALDYRGDRLRFTTDIGYQKQDIDSPSRVRRVKAGVDIPPSPNLTINPGQPWEYYEGDNFYTASRVEYDLSKNLTAYAAFGYANFEELFFGGIHTINNAQGDFTSTPSIVTTTAENYTAEAGVRSEFNTGFVKHQLSFATVGLWRDDGFGSATLSGSPINSNIYDPVYVAPWVGTIPGNTPRSARRVHHGAGVADTMSFFGDRVLLTAGVRWQDIEVTNFNRNTGAVTSVIENKAWSPAVGLVVKPLRNLSLYGNYIEGLTPGEAASSDPTVVNNPGTVLPAYVSEQIEVGAKYDFGSFGASIAAFEITKPSAFIDPVTKIFGVTGEQRNRGVELEVFGEPVPGVRVLGGVAFLDGVLTQTKGGTNDGNTAVGVPDVQLNLYGEYDLPFAWTDGVTLTGRLIYTSSQFYDEANTQSIPDWTRVDLGLRYSFELENGTPMTLRATVENVFDNNYWATTGRGLLTPGIPRTVRLSMTTDF